MPYGRGDRTTAPASPGIGVSNVAQGQEQYRQLLTGLETFDGLTAAFIFPPGTITSSLGQTPLGEKTQFLFTAGAIGDNVRQNIGAEIGTFAGPAVAVIFVNAGGGATSTAARFEATRGADAGVIDFNPLNGTIIAASGAGTKAVRTVQVDGIAWHEVTISFGNAVGVPIAGMWRFTPQIAPSAGNQAVFMAPGFMAMPSTVADDALVPPLTWIPDSGNIGVDEGPVTNASAQGRLPALAHNPALLVKKIPDAYQIEGSDLGRILLCNAGAVVNIALPNLAFGSADFSTLPTGWFCYIDVTEIDTGSALLFDPGVADIIEPWGFDVAGAGSSGVVTSIALETFAYGGLFMLMLVSRSGGVGISPRWRLTPTSAAGCVELTGAGTFTTPFGVRQLRVTGAAGGGGGGSAFPTTDGGGGGAGDAVADFLFPITGPAAAVLFSVGLGGAGAAFNSGVAGSSGTATSFGTLLLGGGGGGPPNYAGGPAGGAGAQDGHAQTVTGNGAVTWGGNGGGNIAGGIGGVVNAVTPSASLPARGGGGAGESTLVFILAAQAGADGFLIVQW